METALELLKLFSSVRFRLETEKQLQSEIYAELNSKFSSVKREVPLDPKNIIDFIVNENCGLEIKLDGSKKAIYYQCERYTAFQEIDILVLATNKSVTLPAQINGKRCFAINLSKAWL